MFSLHLSVSAAELEFVQIILILLVMTFMIIVITCLLIHYRLSALAFLSRLSHTQRDQATQLVGHTTTTMREVWIIERLFHWSVLSTNKKIGTKIKNPNGYNQWLDILTRC